MPRETPAPPQRRRRRWLWAALALLALVLAAPTLLSLTHWPGELIASQLPASAGSLQVGGTSLAWTGPLSIEGLTLTDPAGEDVVAVERVTIAGGLLGLLAGDSSAVSVVVDGPRVNLVVSPGGTNLDALLTEAAARRERNARRPGGSSPTRPVSIVVNNAAVRITDTTTGQRWQLSDAQLRADDPGRGLNAIEATLSAVLSGVVAKGAPAPPAGKITARIGAAEGGGRLAQVTAGSLPLSLVAPLVRRVDPTADLAGWVSLEGKTAWSSEGIAAPESLAPADLLATLLAGDVRSSGVARLAAVDYRGAASDGAVVRLDQIEAPWRLAAAGDRLAIEQLDVALPFGEGRVSGSLTPAEVRNWSDGAPLAPRDLRLTGRVEFDRLAAVAPQLVRLRQDARIESGRLDAEVTCDRGRVQARLQSSPLTGLVGGERIAWRDPIDVRVAAAQQNPQAGARGWAIESLTAESTFFSAKAQGDAGRLKGQLQFDLDRLAEQLRPIVDLGDTRLAGAGSADFDAQRSPQSGRWRLNTSGEVNQLLVGPDSAPLANEPNLSFTAEIDGAAFDETAPTGKIELSAGADELVVELPRGVGAGPQPLRVELSGDAARWWRRVAFLGDLPQPEQLALAGTVELRIDGVRQGDRVEVERANLALLDVAVDTGRLGPDTTRIALKGERIEASGRGVWDSRRRAVSIDDAQLVSSVASARLRNAAFAAGAPESLRGEAVYEVDLGLLGRWFPAPQGPARYSVGGVVTGGVTARGVPEGTSLKLSAKGDRLAIRDREAADRTKAVVWSEPALRLAGDAMVTSVAGPDGRARAAVEFRDTRVESDSLNGTLGGRIADVAAMRGVEVGGGVDYDLEKLTPMLWPSLGDGVRLVGRDRASFRVESDASAPADAPLIRRLAGRIEAPWQGANLFGLAVGPGRLAANLRGGVLQADPIDVAVGQGRLTATATARIDPAPAVVSLRPGPLVTDVAMSAEVNEQLLKYIAPVLADATQIDGKYSLSLADCVLPIDEQALAQQGRAAGVLDVHRVRVTPGPAVAEWVALVRQIQSVARDGVESIAKPRDSVLVAIDNNRTEFWMQQGRVYHRGLAFYVGDALVQSSGSVGLDETLDLVLAVPILDDWVDRRPQYLGRLRGQAIRIPIQGTFSRPKINSDAFRQLSRSLLENAAAGLLEEGLRRLFDK